MKAVKIFQFSFLLFLGIVSVFMTISVIFDFFGIRQLEGNFVPFVVYANLVCGLLYLIALSSKQKSKMYILGFALLILLVTMAFLLMYIKNGGIHEVKTVKAMIFRITLTLALFLSSIYIFKNE